MIQIGNKIWIVDDLRTGFRGHTHTTETSVFFDGTKIGGIKEINLEWNAEKTLGKKWCSVSVVKGGDSAEAVFERTMVERFAKELAIHGFAVEVCYPSADIVEYYHLHDGEIVREEHLCKTAQRREGSNQSEA